MGRRKNRRGRRKVKKKGIRVKAKTQAKPRLPNIPEEVVGEILSRLPLKSLYRFTCVSKQWRSLISEISAKKIGRTMVFVQSTLRSGTLTFHSIDEESRVKRVRRPWKKLRSCYKPVFAGSCNGLLLIIIGADFYLWNPVTRYFKKVLSYSTTTSLYGYAQVSGLCYDSSTNEYKAVTGIIHEQHAFGTEYVVVGSFRSKDWKGVPFPYSVDTVESGPVVNGNLHWYASKGYSDKSHQIVYFNPHMNIFIEVPMPEPRPGAKGNRLLGLGVLDGCLSMVRRDSPRSSEAEVLVMKDYGMQKSWSMLFIISNLTLGPYGYKDKLVPLCCTKYGEALMELSTYSGRKVRAYNLVDSSYKEIVVQPNCRWVDAVVYEESLVTPTGYDWEEEELRGEPTYTEYYLSGHLSKWVRRNGSWNRKEIVESDYE